MYFEVLGESSLRIFSILAATLTSNYTTPQYSIPLLKPLSFMPHIKQCSFLKVLRKNIILVLQKCITWSD